MSENKDLLAASILETIRLMAAHHGLWFAETVHQHGIEQALKAEEHAGGLVSEMALKRLGHQGNPFATLDEAQLAALRETLAKLWLGMDGVWFQAVESLEGMDAAKRVNDTCWARFAPLEARRWSALLKLVPGGGLDALEAALRMRFGSIVNEVAFEREPEALVLRTVTCRVQAARRRKGLADYPCRSAGVTEYSGFARFVDPRIRCECIACPPDPIPQDTYCSWRFRLVSDTKD
ncbi:hypothetical protein NNJEOMEG_00088 [Fundidesulfovibrio magnetotacticus]|uniref:Cytosolic protein n=1 Tax=Fundidesulfovibrio magnetotacticus TaxID=2730080 RepID=A0A6V8LR78_9BACT|nr:DUF6125 family protein [Fundidesulfovibrio magnetotacticus]GFK92266.1 hypothetical protein NNJEOMEG_00088 [Fundidesulfovibrio magnetotacticus]